MSKYERAKRWAKRNEDKILIISFGTVLVGLVIIGIKSDVAYRERMDVELNGYIDELNALHRLEELYV